MRCIALLSLLRYVVAEEKFLISAVGDSMTYGEGDKKGYLSTPTQLRIMLGDDYEMENFGRSGASIVPGPREYRVFYKSKYEDAISSGASMFIVQFGTNDAFPSLWNETIFRAYLAGFVEELRDLPQSPIVVLAVPPPFACWDDKLGYPEDHPVNFDVPRVVPEVARELNVSYANHFELFGGFPNYNTDWYDEEDDCIHPNGDGYLAMAQNLYNLLSEEVWPNYFGTTLTPPPALAPTYAPTTGAPTTNISAETLNYSTINSTTIQPTSLPTIAATYKPTYNPTVAPTSVPTTASPTATNYPTTATGYPTMLPSLAPTDSPTASPSSEAAVSPSDGQASGGSSSSKSSGGDSTLIIAGAAAGGGLLLIILGLCLWRNFCPDLCESSSEEPPSPLKPMPVPIYDNEIDDAEQTKRQKAVPTAIVDEKEESVDADPIEGVAENDLRSPERV